MILTISSRVGVATLVAVTLMASVAVVDASAEVNLRLSAGYAQPTGDVGDQLLGPGADFGLSALALVGERGYVGVGIHLTAFSGQSVGPDDMEDVAINTEDYGSILVEFDNGTHGVMTVNQCAAGRKNRLYYEIDGAKPNPRTA